MLVFISGFIMIFFNSLNSHSAVCVALLDHMYKINIANRHEN